MSSNEAEHIRTFCRQKKQTGIVIVKTRQKSRNASYDESIYLSGMWLDKNGIPQEVCGMP